MDYQQPRVCVLPYRQKLGMIPSRLPLSDLHWPLGVPPKIEGQTLADLLPTDHLLTLPHKSLYLRPSFGTRARVSVMILEPRAIHRRYMALTNLFHRRFHRILTSDSLLLAQVPNSVFFPFGGSWVPQWKETDMTKHAMCSLIASSKKKQSGHKLRHDLVQWSRETGQDIDVMGRGYKPFAKKSEGLAPFRYSVVIENTREQGYFTEKLIDALLCDTVPIYWGCPNIADFFDTKAMMVCEDMADIQCAIKNMSESDYVSRLPALNAARDVAVGYMDVYERGARILLESD
ncbi:MAG: hypothetical protein COB39_11740 [Marinosulfonomonas sp.]|nr:MAG: hypothetical protein COB39_11740 [Marinosulfonomonas sp.]